MPSNYTHVVIDGPPRVNALARSAMLAADMILIPVQPSPYDVWAAREIVALIGEATAFKENLKCAFMINRKIVNTAIGRDVRDALATYDIPVLKTRRFASGSPLRRARPRAGPSWSPAPNSRASQEILSLAREILEEV